MAAPLERGFACRLAYSLRARIRVHGGVYASGVRLRSCRDVPVVRQRIGAMISF